MKRYSRRHVLGVGASAGLAGVGVLAGCLDDPSAGTGSDTRASSGNGDVDFDGGDSDDYPRSTDSDVDDHPSCPEYEDADRTVCYGTADLDDEPVVLEPSTATVEGESSIEFTLRNDGDERFETNFYNWRVHKYVDGEWSLIAPLAHPDPLMSVGPGDEHTWTVTPDNDGIGEIERFRGEGESGTESITLTGVGSGVYAFRARGWVEDARSEEILALGATFELESEPLELTPTPAIESVEWEDDDDGSDGDEDGDDGNGDVLVARSDRGEDDEYHRMGAYELEVVDDPAEVDPESMITEQVIRNDQLRDTIALAVEHDAARVRLEERDHVSPIFGPDSDGVYEYRGTYYRVRTRELEGG